MFSAVTLMTNPFVIGELGELMNENSSVTTKELDFHTNFAPLSVRSIVCLNAELSPILYTLLSRRMLREVVLGSWEKKRGVKAFFPMSVR